MLNRRFTVILWILFFIFPTICIAVTETAGRAEDLFRSGLTFAGEAVPLGRVDVHESLDQELLLLSEAKARVWLTLRRSGRYLPVIEKALDGAEVSRDFKYLPMALSNLDPLYRSGQRRGLWRLSEGEAASMGLSVNKLVDQRLDPEASSAAAAIRLKTLRTGYGSWTMALAAFLDEDALAAAVLEAGGGKDYYLLYVPETLDKAVSQVIAGKILYSDPGVYGYGPSKPWPVLSRSVVRLDAASDMYELAQRYGTDYKTFRDMNPHILTDAAPAGSSIHVP
ncbi:MAG: transglycosylase SLT domain-containing protein [Deltaproteobacteria bacterium]|jgi:hypothetical protein|nr:transglycosylase SLT domain-containing protein [Deltaproteobacteria bacterium]